VQVLKAVHLCSSIERVVSKEQSLWWVPEP